MPEGIGKMTSLCLPRDFVDGVETLGAMQAHDGTVATEFSDEGAALAGKVGPEAARLARRFRQEEYGLALDEDFREWIASGLQERPDFRRSRDALAPPRDGEPFFFTGPLRLANGGRAGWRMESFLALREEPDGDAYRSLYSTYPHPGNICQSCHLLAGSRGLVSGNNIVFFPENIQAEAPLDGQAYAVFFFNKFHRIYNEVTLRKVVAATSGVAPLNPTGDDARSTYLARCVWGYLHDYFHHQGVRPFDEHLSIKTRWFTGLLEELKVDLEAWLACRERRFADAEAVAEFILFDRAFRYPCEPDWHRNFDSGTGLLLLSLLEAKGGLEIGENGRLSVDIEALPAIAREFICEVCEIESSPDESYLAAAKEMVRRYLPEGPDGTRMCLPNGLLRSRMKSLVGSSRDPIQFTPDILRQSLEPANAEVTCEDLKWAVNAYFEACNSGDRQAFLSLFRPDAAHYLPKGMFGPILDVESLFAQWRRDAEENGSYWIIESCLADARGPAAVAEWTAVKPRQKVHFRGVDWFSFTSDGLIEEVRVYYATARNPDLGPNELGGYDYAGASWWTPEPGTGAFGDA